MSTDTLDTTGDLSLKRENHWSKPVGIPGAYSDATPALTSDGSTLYAAYKKLGTNEIWMISFVDGVWGTPTKTNIQSKQGPALAWINSTLYLYWQSVNNKNIDHGHVDPSTFNVSSISQVADAASGNAPAAIGWSNAENVTHTGSSSSSIYYDTTQSGGWKEYKPSNQKSKKSPALAASPDTLYQFHTGEGSKWDHIMMGTLKSGADPKDGWTSDTYVDKAKTDAGPGAAYIAQDGRDYIILAHNGDFKNHILWHYLDVGSNQWHEQGTVGNPAAPVKTEFNPALFWLQEPASEKHSKEPTYGMYLLYAENENTSNQLRWSVLKNFTP